MLCLARRALFCFLLFGSSQASAHFIWIDCHPESGGSCQVRLYFAEGPQPGDAKLIDKIDHAKVWLRAADGESRSLSVARSSDANLAALVATVKQTDQPLIEATCDYGVYQHGPTSMLLQYYAKHLPDGWCRGPGKANRSEHLALDVIPRLDRGSLVLEVLYQGQPVADRQVVVIDETSKQQDFKTDADGRVTLDNAVAGPYAIRAAYIEADRGGSRDGKAYSQTAHYCTATFDVPSKKTDAPELTAAKALAQAREARAIWRDFPGFAADLTVSNGGEKISAKLTIDAGGGVSLSMPKSSMADWVEEELDSLVQHRMPNGEVKEGDVKYADADITHPLGRKIALGDSDLHSSYRIKNDVIMEVSRSMGSERFTISVLEITRNPENKYLPRSFTMNFFDSATGSLHSSRAYWNEWQRVGKFDLPKTILEVATEPSGVVTRQIAFSNARLTTP